MIDPRRRDGRPLRIGHKGAAALAPGNTIAALEQAVASRVDVVEFDVLRLGDGTLVLAHSDDLRDLSRGVVRGRVGDRSLADLRLDLPGLATLEEALAYVAGQEVAVHVDLKWPGYEREVVWALRAHDLVARTLVSSAFAASVRRVAAAEPAVRTGLSYPFDRRGLARRRVLTPAVVAALGLMRAALPARIDGMLDRSGASVATLHHLLLTRAVVARCHRRGVAVWAWTVDSPRAIRRVTRLGVDGVISNDPRAVAATFSPS